MIQKILKNKLFISVGICMLLLTGCMSSGGRNSTLIPTNKIQNWKLAGKIAAVYPDESCKEVNCSLRSDQGSISWEQKKGNYKISISDPFGKVLYKIVGNEQTAELTSGKRVQTISDPNSFIRDNLKMNATISNLKNWLTGRTDNAKKTKCGEDCSSFTQNGFEIYTKQWRKQSVGKVPSYIKIVKGVNVLKIIVREWEKI